jgi:hypothetical protein
LKEELKNEQGLYEQYIQRGHAILDKSDPESADAEAVTKRLDAVNASWDQLVVQINEREACLGNMMDATSQFFETLQILNDWLPVAGDDVDGMTVQTPAEQRELTKVKLL